MLHRLHAFILIALALLLMGRASAVTLPVEVFGKAGTVKQPTVKVPAGKGATAKMLWMIVHGLGYPDKASVQINSGPWLSLSNATVTVAGMGSVYGGIGGAFHTLTVTAPLPAGAVVVDGVNTVRVRFNRSDGTSNGLRVLAFNFLDQGGVKIVPQTQFAKDDPAKWKPPLADALSISEGQRLWGNAPLVNNDTEKKPIKARCADCHMQDGRDLKYFNYSNYSIIERSKFHGLTGLQGKKIASYVRTLNGPAPGWPWWSPFQPGPGLDAKPLSSWMAGAGMDWVLASDLDTLKYVFPAGITKDAIPAGGHLNVREVPIALQLPDWNHWLPHIHPKDAWGDAWTASENEPRYQGLRARLGEPPNLTAYLQGSQSKVDVNTWQLRLTEFLVPRTEADGIVWTPAYAQKVYSTALWQLVKMAELTREFNLEGRGGDYFGALAENRVMFGQSAFKAAPFQKKIPDDDSGIGGSALTNEYFSSAWYHIQLLTNSGNGVGQGTSPTDWAYVWGKFKDFWDVTRTPSNPLGWGELGRFTVYFVKGMQEGSRNGVDRMTGWNIDTKVKMDWASSATGPVKQWAMLPQSTVASVFTAVLGSCLDKCNLYTASQYYAEGYTTPTYVPVPNPAGTLSDRLFAMLGAYKALGVDQATINRATVLLKRINPLAPVAVGTGAD